MQDRLPIVSDRAFAIDAATIVLVSVAICLFTQQLLLMTILVPLIIALRFAALTRLRPDERLSWGTEAIFFTICTVFGGFNDWNSVVNHQIYDYTAPVYFPGFSTIPIWMLLFWGMILRFLFTLFRWQRMAPPEQPSDILHLGPRKISGGWVVIGAQLLLVFATRQTLYRFFHDPWLSWLPFAIALGLYLYLFRPTAYHYRLLALFAVGGPAIEVLYIQVGGMHYYHLGWLGGVPLWIALWWLVIVLIWNDLASRMVRFISRRHAPSALTATPA